MIIGVVRGILGSLGEFQNSRWICRVQVRLGYAGISGKVLLTYTPKNDSPWYCKDPAQKRAPSFLEARFRGFRVQGRLSGVGPETENKSVNPKS